MKIIFLDIDGVLNDETVWGKRVLLGDCVGVLNEIVGVTGAVVVVSSLYRVGKTVYELEKLLRSNGFEGRVIGKTPEIGDNKGQEIDIWLRNNVDCIEGYVILDDEPYGLERFSENLALIDSKKGLTRKYVDRIVEILNQEAA